MALGARTSFDAHDGDDHFNASLRDVLHGFDPFLALGTEPTADDSFQRLTYGGYLLRQGLSQSVPTRIAANRTMERQLLFDIGHPDAFTNTGKFHTALLDEADFALNRAAFAENGYSKGMFYNTYCNARVTLVRRPCVRLRRARHAEQQRPVQGEHLRPGDRRSGSAAPSRARDRNWRSDPFGVSSSPAIRTLTFFDNCDPREQQSTQPSDPSDQKYARWYPSAAPLPERQGAGRSAASTRTTPSRPIPTACDRRAATTRASRTRRSRRAASTSSCRKSTTPKTDRNIALENARMAFPLYPQMEVVQTGPGRDDWKVCTFNGEKTTAPRRGIPRRLRRFGVGGGTPSSRRATTWCLDVARRHEGSEPECSGEEPLDARSTRRPKSAVLLSDGEPDRDQRRR